MANDTLESSEKKSWKLVTIAVLFALMAGVGTMIYLKVLEHRLKERLTPPAKTMTAVIVAADDLKMGTRINTNTVAVRHVPMEYVNSDVITPSSFDSVNGAILTKPLKHGKMLTQDYIDLNIPKDFSDTIKVGHRAMTIQVDEINSISGMIRPGNFIDLYTRLSTNAFPKKVAQNGNDKQGKDLVIPVLEDVLVLATDHTSARPNEDEFIHHDTGNRQRVYNTLTIEITPKEAALLSIAESRGSLIAILRNPEDTGGALFGGITTNDLLHNSYEMLQDALSKQHNRTLAGVHRDKNGMLVTRDGKPLADQGLQIDKNGLITTKDGKILSGRDLVVGPDGKLRTKDGEEIDTKSLVVGKGGSLIDKDGNVLSSNGYKTLKGGFLQDKDGNVLTPDGHILTGVTVDKDGTVRTKDGRALNAAAIRVAKDGTVNVGDHKLAGVHLDDNGNLVDADGNPVEAGDLVTVGPDGIVRTKDGRILDGVHMGKDGQLYTADGKKLSPADVLLAAKGMHLNKDGQLVDKNGNVVKASDLVTVGKDGKVRTKDGRILDGVYRDHDDGLRNKDGSLLTAADIMKQQELHDLHKAGREELLAGVTGKADPKFTANVMGAKETPTPSQLDNYVVEYVVGGTSNGAARTFKIIVDEDPLKETSAEQE